MVKILQSYRRLPDDGRSVRLLRNYSSIVEHHLRQKGKLVNPARVLSGEMYEIIPT